eukprot:TRINITY_DN9448_c0_g1_i2.p2 TRINITY_DN9448_c0_g1~~TRINITY_DN9448_c0_g1_i2.p2  ORF type:complete len:108 (-),score=22.90 TRINITY_DN9448_c0_g1_i2:645-968(-)
MCQKSSNNSPIFPLSPNLLLENSYYIIECLEFIITTFQGFILELMDQNTSEALQTSTALSELILSWNDIGDEGSKYIFKYLEKNSSLKRLKLEGNLLSELHCITKAL